MDENTKRMWDVIFKWIGLFGVLASAWWTVHTYRADKLSESEKLATARIDELKKSDMARTNEQNSFIFQQQATLLLDAPRAASALATSKDPKSLQDARQRFNQLYWGELVVVEDRRVELAMIAFQRCLLLKDKKKTASCAGVRPDQNQHKKPIDIQQLDVDVQPTLENLSLEIGACARTALIEGRKVTFGQVEPAITTCPYD
jgi:hypothetical protein